MTPSDKDYGSMLEEIDDSGTNLTNWEIDFLNDMLDRDPRSFSAFQKKKIEQIWEDRID